MMLAAGALVGWGDCPPPAAPLTPPRPRHCPIQRPHAGHGGGEPHQRPLAGLILHGGRDAHDASLAVEFRRLPYVAAVSRPVVGGGGGVALLGWLDDRYDLSSGRRFLFQGLAAAWARLDMGDLPLPLI